MKEVRVRYAPSPTGMQHIGGVRTALFNYLFAKANNGTFILRLEDTDRTRYGEEFVQNLYDTLDWLNIEWDEGGSKGGEYGPYVQSERVDLYTKHAMKLVEKGEAYYCFCDTERLNRIRLIQQKNKMAPGYDRNCRHLTQAEVKETLDKGLPYVIRLKVPLEGITCFCDALLGDIEWKNEDISPDPVLLKTDGFPTYHLANIVDDHFMKITHVMRAQEWIPSTPLHVQIYRAFGWEPPVFCHLPMVNGSDGHKLSKRHGATSVNEFMARGYLPEALINYVGMLGCSYEDGRDMYTLSDMAALFKMEHLNKAGAVFDYKKLEWFNGQYIRNLSDEELLERILPFITFTGISTIPINETEEFAAPKIGPKYSGVKYLNDDPATDKLILADPTMKEIICAHVDADTATQDVAIRNKLREVVPLIKERLHFLTDAAEIISFLFKNVRIPSVEKIIPKRLDKEQTKGVLEQAIKYIESMKNLEPDAQEQLARDTAKELGIKMGDFMMPIRWAVTGSKISPPLMGSIMVLGPDIAIKRIKDALADF
ncbi:MAG TPA: glutamate--tRNA ligase [Treponemataceae bacterium]|nr:glutamate--tRNA ligase [Treponemataceae bacterium]